MICCFSLTIFPLETTPIQIIESQKFHGGAECIIIRSLQYTNKLLTAGPGAYTALKSCLPQFKVLT